MFQCKSAKSHGHRAPTKSSPSRCFLLLAFRFRFHLHTCFFSVELRRGLRRDVHCLNFHLPSCWSLSCLARSSPLFAALVAIAALSLREKSRCDLFVCLPTAQTGRGREGGGGEGAFIAALRCGVRISDSTRPDASEPQRTHDAPLSDSLCSLAKRSHRHSSPMLTRARHAIAIARGVQQWAVIDAQRCTAGEKDAQRRERDERIRSE